MSETLQAIVQIVLTPILIVGAFAFVIRELFKSYLSMDIEKYKVELQNDLESHKAKLKLEADARQFEFQTKFSSLHQKRAERIEELHGRLLELISQLYSFQTFMVLHEAQRNPNDVSFEGWSNELTNLQQEFNDTKLSYQKSRIYFEDDLCKQIEEVLNFAQEMLGNYELRERRGSLLKRPGLNSEQIMQIIQTDREAFRNFLAIAPKLQKTLEVEFRKTLSFQSEKQEILK